MADCTGRVWLTFADGLEGTAARPPRRDGPPPGLDRCFCHLPVAAVQRALTNAATYQCIDDLNSEI